MAKRARDRVAARAPRFEVDAEEQERLLLSFLDATRNGDVDTLIAALTEDAELHTDHGGKAAAAKRVIYGASKIARFVVGVTQRFSPEGVETRVMTINGRPGVVSFVGDQPESVLTVDIVDGKIAQVYVVRNPDKLQTLDAVLAET